MESVWDYPRPPRLEANTKHLVVRFAGRTLADTRRGYRILETSYPRVYYFSLDAVDCSLLDVTPQPGGFYGGWITADITGPFKGEPDSWGW